MEYVSTFKLDEVYWKEAFYQSYLKSGLRRKVTLLLGFICVAYGFFLLFTNIPIYVAILLIFMGAFNFFGLPIKFHLWKYRNGLNRRYKDKLQFIFQDKEFIYKGKDNEGIYKWTGVIKSIETPKGFLLWTQKNISVYIPKYSMDEKTETFLRDKCLVQQGL